MNFANKIGRNNSTRKIVDEGILNLFNIFGENYLTRVYNLL